VALAHKIKQTNSQQQQKAPLRQAITKHQPTWQGLLPQKQKTKKQDKKSNTGFCCCCEFVQHIL